MWLALCSNVAMRLIELLLLLVYLLSNDCSSYRSDMLLVSWERTLVLRMLSRSGQGADLDLVALAGWGLAG